MPEGSPFRKAYKNEISLSIKAGALKSDPFFKGDAAKPSIFAKGAPPKRNAFFKDGKTEEGIHTKDRPRKDNSGPESGVPKIHEAHEMAIRERNRIIESASYYV